jgi:hypothetical protein
MLDRLRQLLPPPADPVEPGRLDGWAQVERRLGTALPGDFKAFTERYGSGTVDDFLYLFNPFAQGPDGNLLVEKDRVLAAYRQTRARFPDRLPLPPFPEPGGDELYWVTDGHPVQLAGGAGGVARSPPGAARHAGDQVPGRAGQPARLPRPSRQPARPSQPPVHAARLSREEPAWLGF